MGDGRPIYLRRYIVHIFTKIKQVSPPSSYALRAHEYCGRRPVWYGIANCDTCWQLKKLSLLCFHSRWLPGGLKRQLLDRFSKRLRIPKLKVRFCFRGCRRHGITQSVVSFILEVTRCKLNYQIPLDGRADQCNLIDLPCERRQKYDSYSTTHRPTFRVDLAVICVCMYNYLPTFWTKLHFVPLVHPSSTFITYLHITYTIWRCILYICTRAHTNARVSSLLFR